MKNNYAFLVVLGLIVAITSCKKDINGVADVSAVTGKWQETKVRVYTKNAAGVVTGDTTYSGQTFTNLDYAEFYSNGTCVISSDHDYYPIGQGLPTTPQTDITTNTLIFTPAASAYVLTPNTTLINPGGFVTTDTATVITPKSLLIRFTSYGHAMGGPSTVYDSYFVK